MKDARQYSDKAIAIRAAKLESDDLDLAISCTNDANTLLNESRVDECLKDHPLADKIWMNKAGVDEVYRGLTYLNVGRVHSLPGDGPVAISYFRKAENFISGISNNIFLIGQAFLGHYSKRS